MLNVVVVTGFFSLVVTVVVTAYLSEYFLAPTVNDVSLNGT